MTFLIADLTITSLFCKNLSAKVGMDAQNERLRNVLYYPGYCAN